jgi:fumarate reductase subunit C
MGSLSRNQSITSCHLHFTKSVLQPNPGSQFTTPWWNPSQYVRFYIGSRNNTKAQVLLIHCTILLVIFRIIIFIEAPLLGLTSSYHNPLLHIFSIILLYMQ